MGRKCSTVAVSAAVLVMLLAGATVTSASIIAYETTVGNRGLVMIMDESGANPVRVHTGVKFNRRGFSPTVSPPGPDGEAWIAFRARDLDFERGSALFRVKSDGTGQVKMLCGQGTRSDGESYNLSFHQRWSPDGTRILDRGWGELDYLALIPADSIAPSDCSSDFEVIYSDDPGNEYGLDGSAAWNDDGSKIAFFEYRYDEVDDYIVTGVRLVILEHQDDSGQWVRQNAIDPYPVLPNTLRLSLDWQRGGSVLAFASRDETDQGVHFWLMWLDMNTGESGYLSEGGSPIEARYATWSPDGTQLVFTDDQGSLVKRTYLGSGELGEPGEVLGSGDWADWQRDPLVVACGDDLDCDDGKECTVDSCSGQSLCVNLPVVDGTSCNSGFGSCYSGICETPECWQNSDCNDGDACTSDECLGGECLFTPIPGCGCLQKGDACSVDDDCCNNKCRGGKCR